MIGAARSWARKARGRAAVTLRVAVCAALALPTQLRAQDTQDSERQPVEPTRPAPATSTQEDKQEARWVLSESELELSTLGEMCASGLDLHLEFDRAKLEGKISLDRPGNFTLRELWDVFNRELAELGEASDNSST